MVPNLCRRENYQIEIMVFKFNFVVVNKASECKDDEELIEVSVLNLAVVVERQETY